MATARDIIIGAMKLINVIESNADPTAEEARDGLIMLNDMCHQWTAQEIHVGFSTLGINDSMPLAEAHIGGVKDMLAVRMADEYGKAASPETKARANEAKSLLRAEYRPSQQMRLDDGLLCMPSQRRYW